MKDSERWEKSERDVVRLTETFNIRGTNVVIRELFDFATNIYLRYGEVKGSGFVNITHHQPLDTIEEGKIKKAREYNHKKSLS